MNLIRERIGAAGTRRGGFYGSERTSRGLHRSISTEDVILLTVAGEERLALDIEEWMDGLDFSGLPPDAKPTPGIYH